jgi:hypothetical protein
MSQRWHTIGRTRIKLAAILTAAIRADGAAADVEIRPEQISPMRLVGNARIWEDAHSWEAFPTRSGGDQFAFYHRHSIYSYNTMTEIVKAGGIEWIGKDGECIAAPSKQLVLSVPLAELGKRT